jgi:hypothetical protein
MEGDGRGGGRTLLTDHLPTVTDQHLRRAAPPLVRAGSVPGPSAPRCGRGPHGRRAPPARRGTGAVGVQGDAGGGVAELTLHHLDAGALTDQQPRGRVPKVVAPQRRRPGGGLEGAGHPLGLAQRPPSGAVNTRSSGPWAGQRGRPPAGQPRRPAGQGAQGLQAADRRRGGRRDGPRPRRPCWPATVDRASDERPKNEHTAPGAPHHRGRSLSRRTPLYRA